MKLKNVVIGSLLVTSIGVGALALKQNHDLKTKSAAILELETERNDLQKELDASEAAKEYFSQRGDELSNESHLRQTKLNTVTNLLRQTVSIYANSNTKPFGHTYGPGTDYSDNQIESMVDDSMRAVQGHVDGLVKSENGTIYVGYDDHNGATYHEPENTDFARNLLGIFSSDTALKDACQNGTAGNEAITDPAAYRAEAYKQVTDKIND